MLGLGIVLGLMSLPVLAQLNDVIQTPNAENEGIKKTLSEQVGAGQGDEDTPDSSIFIIKRDPFRSIARGRQLFQRKFTLAEGFGPRTNDGVGNIEADPSHGAGLVDSCAGCHGRPRGSAGVGGNVFTAPDSRDAPHLFGLGLVEMLADEITGDLRQQRDDAVSDASSSGQSQTVNLWSKGINYGSITAHPNGSVDDSGLEGVDSDLRVKPFFAHGATFSMRDFAAGAFNAEMGLESPDPILLAASNGATVVTPSGLVLNGSLDFIPPPPVSTAVEDSDNDGVVNEIDPALIDHMEFYLLNYFKPGLYNPSRSSGDDDDDDDDDGGNDHKGLRIMEQIGCTSCHIQDLLIENDRRVADVETVYDPVNGIFNDLFATASPLFTTASDPDNPDLPDFKNPAGGTFLVKNIFADFKRHDLGPNFWERRFDGTLIKEFVTEPLWGVGTTAPYGHDGRSINLDIVIRRHGGEAQASRDAYVNLSHKKQRDVREFLATLVLFPPPDTASNLNPGNPAAPDFPQRGHGSIDLSVLFNDPSDAE